MDTEGFTQKLKVELPALWALSFKRLSIARPEVLAFYKVIYDNLRKVIVLIEHFKVGKDMLSGMYLINKRKITLD